MSNDDQALHGAAAPSAVHVLHAHRAPEGESSRWPEHIASVLWTGLVVAGILSLDAPIGATLVLVVVCASALPLVFELRDTRRRLSALALVVDSSRDRDD